MQIDRLACPACHVPLAARADAFVCDRCSSSFPVVDGAPILVRDPARYLAQVVAQFERAFALREQLVDKLARIKGTPEGAFRAATFDRIIRASDSNLTFLRSQYEPARAALAALGAPASPLADVGYAPGTFNYLRSDWSGHPDAERQIETVESALFDQIRRFCDAAAGAVVLGAGAGRVLFDLARIFDAVVGVDLSYPFVHAFHQLAKRDLDLSLIELKAPRSRDEMVVDFTARMPADRSALERCSYVAADALSLPLADASVGTVVMTFFADVVPLPVLLREVRRVLMPNGRVVNIGPLDYHFSDVTWLLSPEEAQEVIERAGFHFEEQQWLDLTFFDQPRGYRRTYRVWSYTLRAQ